METLEEDYKSGARRRDLLLSGCFSAVLFADVSLPDNIPSFQRLQLLLEAVAESSFSFLHYW